MGQYIISFNIVRRDDQDIIHYSLLQQQHYHGSDHHICQ